MTFEDLEDTGEDLDEAFGIDEEGVGEAEPALSALEEVAAEAARPGAPRISAEEIVSGFVARTPTLTGAERAALLAEALEGQGYGEFDWGRLGSALQTGIGALQAGAQIAGGVASQFGGPGARRAANVLSGIRTGLGAAQQGVQIATQVGGQLASRRPGGRTADVLAGIQTGLGALQQGAQLAGQVAGQFGGPGAQRAANVLSGIRTGLGVAQQGAQLAGQVANQFGGPQRGTAANVLAGIQTGLGALQQGAQLAGQLTGGSPAAGAPLDATATIQALLGNPQLQQALRWATVLGPSAPRSVNLSVPASTQPGDLRDVQIPLGAVMNALQTLAGEAMAELDANTAEDDQAVPEYLLGESGEPLVDLASPEERAALVIDLFRRSRAAEWAGGSGEGGGPTEDEADTWAREAGWTR